MLFGTLPTPGPCELGVISETPALSDYSLESGLVNYLSSVPAINSLVGSNYFPLFIDRSNPPGTWPAIVYEVSELEHVNTIQGCSGLVSATVEITCYSNDYSDVVKLGEAVRFALHGFSGWMGCVATWGIWPQGQDDEVEAPQDSSGTWWFGRTLTYSIQYYEPVPLF